MSTWITDRLPTENDADRAGLVWCAEKADEIPCVTEWDAFSFETSAAWQPRSLPKPYSPSATSEFWVISNDSDKNGKPMPFVDEYYTYQRVVLSKVEEPLGLHVRVVDTNELPSEEKERLFARIAQLESFVSDIYSNWDCDSDAHKYGTPCRCCEAARLLDLDEDCGENDSPRDMGWVGNDGLP